MAVRFDAASDRISYTASNPPAPGSGITVAGWYYVAVDRNDFSTLLRLHAGGGGSTTLTLGTGGDGVTPQVFSAGGSVAGTASTVGAWYRIGYTLTGTSATLYQATAAGATGVFTGSVTPGATPTGLTVAGRSDGDSDEPFDGRIAYLRVWSAVLTQPEVEAEWASATAVRTSGLWASWPLEVHTDLTDLSGNGRNLVAGVTATTTEDGPPLATAITGSGTCTAPLSVAAGTGTVTVSGSGSLTASTAVAVGAGSVVVTGSGAAVTTTAALSGAGTALIGGQGALVPAQATAAGAGQVLITGAGTLVAPAAVASGSDEPPAETPASRMFVVPAESRVSVVPAESRMFTVEA